MSVLVLSTVIFHSLISHAFYVESKTVIPFASVKWTSVGSSPKDLLEATCPQGFQMHYVNNKTKNDFAVHVKDRQQNAAWLYCKNGEGKVTTPILEVFN